MLDLYKGVGAPPYSHFMAEFLVKNGGWRGHVLQQVESGVSEQGIRDRFVQAGLHGLLGQDRRGLLPVAVARKKLLKADQLSFQPTIF